jgi:hypothetical protein
MQVDFGKKTASTHDDFHFFQEAEAYAFPSLERPDPIHRGQPIHHSPSSIRIRISSRRLSKRFSIFFASLARIPTRQ